MEKRLRRQFTAEYKAEVVRLVREGGKSLEMSPEHVFRAGGRGECKPRQEQPSCAHPPAGLISTTLSIANCR
jgi:hypothetical protein